MHHRLCGAGTADFRRQGKRRFLLSGARSTVFRCSKARWRSVSKNCYEKAGALDITIHVKKIMPEHVHLFVESTPMRGVAEIVNWFKGYSSHILREEFPHLRSRMPTLWSRSYYAGTVGHVSEATVRKYIENQKRK